MNRAAILASALLLTTGMASAQYMQPYAGQISNPYVNMLGNANGNFNPAVSYLGIVQPQLQAQSNFQQLQNGLNLQRMMPGGVAPPRNAGVADTGYTRARFMQYQQYFNTLSTRTGVNFQNQAGAGSAAYGGR